MSSQFYNRYVPPVKVKKLKEPNDARAAKRRRVDEDRVDQPDEENETTEEQKPKRNKVKKAKVDSEASEKLSLNGQDSTRPSSNSLDAKRHKKLKRKLQQTAIVNDQSDTIEALENTAANELNGSIQDDHPDAPTESGLFALPQPDLHDEPMASTIQALPEWLQKPTRVSMSSKRAFSDFLPESMTEALFKNGYETATPIQQGLLPILMPGSEQYPGDICVASSTGTGKTLAFLAPMIQSLRDRPVRRLRGLVIVPTREIISQTHALARICASKSGLEFCSATGVRPIREERKLLIRKAARYDKPRWKKTAGAAFDPVKYETSDDDASDKEYKFMQVFPGFVPDYRSKADVLICTPGRLVEHLKTTKGFTLDHVEWLIVDEMDRLLDQSFQDWLDAVLPALEHDPRALSIEDEVKAGLTYIRRPRRVRKVLASATVTFDPQKLAAMHLWRPKLVTLQLEDGAARSGHFQIPSTLREKATAVDDVADKPLVLLCLLRNIFASSEGGVAWQHRSRLVSAVKADSADDYTSSSGSSSAESTSDSGSDSGSESGSNSSVESTSSGGSSDDSSDSKVSLPQRPQTPGVLVFTTKNENAMRLSRLLTILDPKLAVGAFTGSSRASDRRKELAAFKKGRQRILIASNLASRSLNLTGLEYVVNYDVPTSVEMYIHRVGRTARAGRSGTGNTLLAHHEARWFWNEIARSTAIERSQNVERSAQPVIAQADRDRYEAALQQLGEQAQSAAGG